MKAQGERKRTEEGDDERGQSSGSRVRSAQREILNSVSSGRGLLVVFEIAP